MKGDFSRDTFDPVKHFSRVLQQQGRVQVDADSNEQVAILLHYLRTLAADLIGPFAGPDGADGFQITRELTGATDDFIISPGRYYVDGILCENEAEVTYNNQKDLPNPRELVSQVDYLVYLDVWERHITSLEDDYIREKALGGPDTASRTQVVWQVKIDDGKLPVWPNFVFPFKADEMRDQWPKWIERWQPPHRGCLKARVERPENSNDPCLTAPDAKYRGQENQLYRVEIHQGGSANKDATFKWSRDNGAVISHVEMSGAELVAEKPQGFTAGIWVELSNDGQELRGEPGTLIKLLKVEDDRLILESSPSKPAGIRPDEDWPTKARRWDQREAGSLKLKDGAVPLVESGIEWTELENGIQIQFLPAKDIGNIYRTGDYWLIPARVATGSIEWPTKLENGEETSIPRAPFGIQHHYAPLAILTPNPSNPPEDCRCQITPLNSCGLLSSGEEGIGGHATCS